MRRWEFAVLILSDTAYSLTTYTADGTSSEDLDEGSFYDSIGGLGAEGWELFAVNGRFKSEGAVEMWFKRPTM